MGWRRVAVGWVLGGTVATAWAVGVVDPALIWSGASGGVTVTWTTGDVMVRRGGSDGEPVFSVRAEAERAWRRANAAGDRTCTEDRGVEVLSVVGPLVSISIQADGVCGGAAHPYASRRWAALDMARVDQGRPAPVRLTAIAPEADLLHALVLDPVVRAALSGTGEPPATLAALFETLATHPIVVGGCTFDLTDDDLTSFAFHHLPGGDRMAVRLALPYRDEACRGQIAQLGLDLPMPDRLRAELAQAGGRRVGFLLQDQKAVATGRRTAFRLEPPPPRVDPAP